MNHENRATLRRALECLGIFQLMTYGQIDRVVSPGQWETVCLSKAAYLQ